MPFKRHDGRVEIDLILKGIKTVPGPPDARPELVEIDLILKGIKTRLRMMRTKDVKRGVEIDLILKGIKTT